MEWQPIETAPKERHEDIIVFCDGDVLTASYWDEWYGRSCEAGWMPSNMDEEYGKLIYPTHWMPLPPAPETNQ